jgi:dienelactone hydrolase
MMFQHLGIYSDWVEAARGQRVLFPPASPGLSTRLKLREVLGFDKGAATPLDVRVEDDWKRDGLEGEEVSWSVGYGPRTHAYVLRPADLSGPLPGILALHDHGGFKFYGKEKIADGREDPPAVVVDYRDAYYGNRAYANALAKEGFVVLVHDTFLWGSRRFPLEDMPEGILELTHRIMDAWQGDTSMPAEIQEYNEAAAQHEFLIEKYCALLGTTMAGVVSYEDRVALNYMLSRPDVEAKKVGCIGLSGGGNRSALLLATHEGIRAAVIVGLMSSYAGLLDHNVYNHTWMLFPHGWARYGDWPDIAACRAPMPLLVQYDLEDDLFTREGMQEAHERIAGHYQHAGQPAAYTGQFYPGPHKFDLEMQAAAFAWLKQALGITD